MLCLGANLSNTLKKIKLISPRFDVDNSDWREHLLFTWTYLHQYYEIERTSRRNTRIIVTRQASYDLKGCRRIAQAIIHFEPALRKLQRGESEQPNLGDLLKANWRDNPCLKGVGTDQPQSIALLEALFDDDHPMDWTYSGLSSLMGSKGDETEAYESDYYWQFRDKFYEFIFCNPPPLISAADAIW